MLGSGHGVLHLGILVVFIYQMIATLSQTVCVLVALLKTVTSKHWQGQNLRASHYVPNPE